MNYVDNSEETNIIKNKPQLNLNLIFYYLILASKS